MLVIPAKAGLSTAVWRVIQFLLLMLFVRKQSKMDSCFRGNDGILL